MERQNKMFHRSKKSNTRSMKKPYPAVAIANYWIKCGRQEKIKLSLLQLIKLTYIAHGWHLAYYQQPLIDEAVEAWYYGPMITSIRDCFRNVA